MPGVCLGVSFAPPPKTSSALLPHNIHSPTYVGLQKKGITHKFGLDYQSEGTVVIL